MRDYYLKARLTQEEYETLVNMYQESGEKNISEYLRKIIFHLDRDEKDLRKIMFLLRKSETDVNHILKLIKADHEDMTERQILECKELLIDILNEVKKWQ